MASFLAGMTTGQKVMLAGGAGLVGLFMIGGFGKKKGGGGGADQLGIVDIRRPTDDINAPAGIPRLPDIIVNVGGGGPTPGGGTNPPGTGGGTTIDKKLLLLLFGMRNAGKKGKKGRQKGTGYRMGKYIKENDPETWAEVQEAWKELKEREEDTDTGGAGTGGGQLPRRPRVPRGEFPGTNQVTPTTTHPALRRRV